MASDQNAVQNLVQDQNPDGAGLAGRRQDEFGELAGENGLNPENQEFNLEQKENLQEQSNSREPGHNPQGQVWSQEQNRNLQEQHNRREQVNGGQDNRREPLHNPQSQVWNQEQNRNLQEQHNRREQVNGGQSELQRGNNVAVQNNHENNQGANRGRGGQGGRGSIRGGVGRGGLVRGVGGPQNIEIRHQNEGGYGRSQQQRGGYNAGPYDQGMRRAPNNNLGPSLLEMIPRSQNYVSDRRQNRQYHMNDAN